MTYIFVLCRYDWVTSLKVFNTWPRIIDIYLHLFIGEEICWFGVFLTSQNAPVVVCSLYYRDHAILCAWLFCRWSDMQTRWMSNLQVLSRKRMYVYTMSFSVHIFVYQRSSITSYFQEVLFYPQVPWVSLWTRCSGHL